MTEQPPFPPFNPNVVVGSQTAPVEPPTKQLRKKGATPAAEPAAEPRQRRKKANGEKSPIKIDLKTALELSAILNKEDQEAFEELVGTLQDMGKPTRDRILAAIAKIFA